MKIAVIGGGAAGFFSALSVKEHHPHAHVSLFEKSNKLLAKVKISGGGRCNVTNGCTSIRELTKAYPRGGKKLKKAFNIFNTVHAMAWFESRNVPLLIQEDQCVFPVSQDSQTIIDCFLGEAHRLDIQINMGFGVKKIQQLEAQLELQFIKADQYPLLFDKVIVATGGSPSLKGLEWLKNLGHQILPPVPSLFTFNMPDEAITKLMGIVVESAIVSIQGSKLQANGPLLITHWGMSGPAILKLSAFGARELSDRGYTYKAQVNWVNEKNNNAVSDTLSTMNKEHSKKLLRNLRPYFLPNRLWLYLLEKCGLSSEQLWGELGNKSINRLMNLLTNDVYQVRGKTTFKEEFVTCGGVSLDSIDMNTMQSKICPNLYFTGEVMDVDGITGGYNFQAAWTTGYIAGQLK